MFPFIAAMVSVLPVYGQVQLNLQAINKDFLATIPKAPAFETPEGTLRLMRHYHVAVDSGFKRFVTKDKGGVLVDKLRAVSEPVAWFHAPVLDKNSPNSKALLYEGQVFSSKDFKDTYYATSKGFLETDGPAETALCIYYNGSGFSEKVKKTGPCSVFYFKDVTKLE